MEEGELLGLTEADLAMMVAKALTNAFRIRTRHMSRLHLGGCDKAYRGRLRLHRG